MFYVELLDLSLAADLARVSAEGDDLLLGDDVGEVSLGAGESHALDGGGSLSGVLEVHAEINTSGLAGCVLKKMKGILLEALNKRVVMMVIYTWQGS